MAWDWPGYKQVPSVTAGGTQPVETEIDRLRAELAKFDGMLPVPAEDANDLDDVIRELGIEDSFTTPADAVRELKADLAAKDARIAALEAAGNRLGDAAVDGVLTSIEAVTELAEWKEQFRVLAILEQQKTAELAEAALAIVQSKGQLKEKVALLASENGCLRAELSQTKRDLKDWQDSSEAYRHDAEKAEADCKRAEAEELKAKAHIAALCDAMVYSDSYGVQGSDFQCCHACNAGGAPNVAFKHDERCPVGKAEASAAEWWDDYKAAEEDRISAEAERDALRGLLALAVQWVGLRSPDPDWVTKARAELNSSKEG